MKKFLIGDGRLFASAVWLGITVIAAARIASQFASDSPCRTTETTGACHGRRVAEAHPLILVLIFAGWIVITFVLPRVIRTRRTSAR